MFLGTDSIRQRLDSGEIFRETTWIPGSIKEASYALRVANDGMIIDGEPFEPDGEGYSKLLIEIQPGRIAILSTLERLCMPPDLVGKIGIRLEFAAKGLVGFMGIQVDPYYGQNQPEERLYIKVANLGNEVVRFRPGTAVFNIEFSQVEGAAEPSPPRPPTWDRLIDSIRDQEQIHWTSVTRVQSSLEVNAQDFQKRVATELTSVRNNQQSVVMFGVFLVAVTILGAMIAVILSVRNSPNWVADWGWVALLSLCVVAVIGIVAFLFIAGLGFWRSTKTDNMKLS